MIQSLPKDALDLEKELAFAKVRMQLRKEQEEREDEDAGLGTGAPITAEDEGKLEELEAESRQVFDPIRKIFDDRKRRITDLT